MPAQPPESPEDRSVRGRQKESALFPAKPDASQLPTDYVAVLDDIRTQIREARLRTVLAANAALVLLYWEIGRLILSRQQDQGWGAKVIDRLSADLRETFPDMKGLSARNLKYMRAFAEAWPERKIVQEALAQIPWYHQIALLQKCKDPIERLWYAQQSAEQGWSHRILTHHIERKLYERQGNAIHNFDQTLPPSDSDLAAQVFKDPYLFDFLGTADLRREREVEQALIDHVQQFLLELGQGFAFVGRQMPLEVGQQDFYLDLLFYHLKLRRFVVVELKAVPFDPGFVGQMNLYLSAVDDLLRHPDDQPTIGLLLCKSKTRLVVEYALRGLRQPIGVAEWETQLTESLPEEWQGSLPTVQQIEAELGLGR